MSGESQVGTNSPIKHLKKELLRHFKYHSWSTETIIARKQLLKWKQKGVRISKAKTTKKKNLHEQENKTPLAYR